MATTQVSLGVLKDGAVTPAKLSSQALRDLAGLTFVQGDTLYHDGTNLVRLAKGTDGQVLTLSSGVPAWADAAGGGAWEFIERQNITSGVSTIDLTSGTYSDYDAIRIKVQNLHPASASGLQFLASTNGGSTWLSEYNWVVSGAHSGNGSTYNSFNATDGSAWSSVLKLMANQSIYTGDATSSFAGTITLHNPGNSTYRTLMTWEGGYIDNTDGNSVARVHGTGHIISTGVNAARLKMSTGNIDHAIVSVWGLKTA